MTSSLYLKVQSIVCLHKGRRVTLGEGLECFFKRANVIYFFYNTTPFSILCIVTACPSIMFI